MIHLTPRDREVLALLAEGLLNKEIGRRLGISERAVQGRLSGNGDLEGIYRRIGVRNRVEAARWWAKNGGGPLAADAEVPAATDTVSNRRAR